VWQTESFSGAANARYIQLDYEGESLSPENAFLDSDDHHLTCVTLLCHIGCVWTDSAHYRMAHRRLG
jgi:hypothetical protein